ncbi:hypothetical protein O3M35_006664 [Rhynocoris fuscipes]|uniref:Uncharacterized protein n=1 Tax=Rhynocoris fuscipes TaxID=488301 RepID=A0AAW1DEK4_9HEMI
MSNSGNLETLVNDYLSKVKKVDSEELSYAKHLPKTESVADLLKRVTKTPQILQNLITTSLPYLLITPQKNNQKKLMRSNDNVPVESPKKLVKKKSVFTARSETKHTSESLPTTNRQNKTTKKKLPNKKHNKITKKSKKSTKTTCDGNAKDNISMSKKKNTSNKKEELLSVSLNKSLLEDPINVENKITNALKNSSLLSITEKSYLSLNNYAPVEVDTLLLQKLIALDKQSAKEVINIALRNDNGIIVPENSEVSDDTSEKNVEIKKKKKLNLKRKLVKELKMILLARLKSDKDRPAEILYNVILKLCKKNKIVNGIHFKKVQKVKKLAESSSKLVNGMTSKIIKQGTPKLRALINQHQQLLEKIQTK